MDLDSAWLPLRDQLVAAGGVASGASVLIERAKRTVIITQASIAGHDTVLLLAPIANASDCDLGRALVLAKDLEIGALIVVRGMLAVRHAMPAKGTDAAAVLEVVETLTHGAAHLAPVVIDRAKTRPDTSAFAHCAE